MLVFFITYRKGVPMFRLFNTRIAEFGETMLSSFSVSNVSNHDYQFLEADSLESLNAAVVGQGNDATFGAFALDETEEDRFSILTLVKQAAVFIDAGSLDGLKHLLLSLDPVSQEKFEDYTLFLLESAFFKGRLDMVKLLLKYDIGLINEIDPRRCLELLERKGHQNGDVGNCLRLRVRCLARIESDSTLYSGSINEAAVSPITIQDHPAVRQADSPLPISSVFNKPIVEAKQPESTEFVKTAHQSVRI